MVTTYCKEFTSGNLDIKQWHNYSLSKTSNGLIKVSDGTKFILSYHIYLYDNGHILAEVSADGQKKFRLITPNSVAPTPLLYVSFEIYDGKYRITKDIDDSDGKTTASVISEDNGLEVIRHTKWKDIKEIRDGLLIIEVRQNVYALLSFTWQKKCIDLLGGGGNVTLIEYVSPHIYKFKTNNSNGRYYIFNAKLRSSSRIPHAETFDDIKPLSDRLVMGVTGEDVSFMLLTTNPIKQIAVTEGSAPVFDRANNRIHIKGYYGDDDVDAHEFDIDYDGVLIENKANVSDATARFRAYNETHLSTNQENRTESVSAVPETKEFIPYNIRRLYTNNIQVEHLWILDGDKNDFIITKKTLGLRKVSLYVSGRDGSSEKLGAIFLPNLNKFILIFYHCKEVLMNRIEIAYQEELLPSVKDSILNYAKKPVSELKCNISSVLSSLQYDLFYKLIQPKFDKNVSKLSTSEDKVGSSTITPKVNIINSQVSKDDINIVAETKIEVTSYEEKQLNEQTIEAYKIKDVYNFLKSQDFNIVAIFKSISELFPSFEKRMLGLTNVKIDHNDLYERIELLDTYSRSKNDVNFILEQLHLNPSQKQQLGYEIIVKGETFAHALSLIDKNNELHRVYTEIMNSEALLKEAWEKLGHYVLVELVVNLPERAADISTIEKKLSTEVPVSKDSSYAIPINEKTLILHLNDKISYEEFSKKRVYFWMDEVKYIQDKKNVFLFLDKKTAEKLDQEKSMYVQLWGEGKDQQLFMNTNVNSKIRDQHQNNARILVFKRNDAESCIFFDEYEFVKYETINNKILFTYKSILRYKTF